MERAFEEVAAALAAGEIVVIFPEGAITRTGELQPFRSGITRILERSPVPVVPIALSGLWGSSFSRQFRGLARLVPRRLFSRIRLSVGPAVAPHGATPRRLFEQVLALRGNMP